MTTSEWIRVALIVVCVLVLLARRYKWLDTLREGRDKKKRQEAKQRQRAELKDRRQQEKKRLEAKQTQTAAILKRGLGRLQQRSIKAASQELWYLEGGARPDAQTVVLLHGFAGAKEDWAEVGRLLIDQSYHLVAPDLPGFGQNAKHPELAYDVTTQTKRVRAFLQKKRLSGFHLVGHSVGGSIAAAIAYSAAQDVASLTLIEPFGVRVPYESELDKLLAEGRNPLVIASPTAYDNLLGFVYHNPPELPPALKKLRAEQAAENRVLYLKIWKQSREGERANLLDLLLPEMKLKTLVLQGAQSQVVHPATPGVIQGMMAGGMTSAATIEDCGHFPMLEQPQATADHLVEFFKSIPVPAPDAAPESS